MAAPGINEAEARTRLIELRDVLRADSDASAADRAPVKLDQQSVGRLSRMDAMAGQNMAAAAERSRQARLVRIEQALRRLDDGD